MKQQRAATTQPRCCSPPFASGGRYGGTAWLMNRRKKGKKHNESGKVCSAHSVSFVFTHTLHPPHPPASEGPLIRVDMLSVQLPHNAAGSLTEESAEGQK